VREQVDMAGVFARVNVFGNPLFAPGDGRGLRAPLPRVRVVGLGTAARQERGNETQRGRQHRDERGTVASFHGDISFSVQNGYFFEYTPAPIDPHTGAGSIKSN
jgi:hypothetical protein